MRVICPYCSYETEVELENPDDGDLIESTCDHCEQVFVSCVSISIDLEPHKADCLNGAEHNKEPFTSGGMYPNGWRCIDCEHEERGEFDNGYWARIGAAV